jgi:hypothetical protein
LSDGELLAELRNAVAAERQATARLIGLLIELDSRRLFLAEGSSSLFTYCTQALHLSEHAAYNRIEAARAARRFPLILDLIEQGALTLTAVRLLAPHLTADNYREVLARARHKGKREIELLVAAVAPRPDEPMIIRKLPSPSRPADPAQAPMSLAPSPSERAAAALSDLASGVATLHITPQGVRPVQVVPLTPERYKVQFTVSRETHDKLRRAQDLSRHTNPSGDLAAIFDRALDLLLSQLERQAARP